MYTCRKGHTGEAQVVTRKGKSYNRCKECRRIRDIKYNSTSKAKDRFYKKNLRLMVEKGDVLSPGTKAIYKPYKEPLQPLEEGFGFLGTIGMNETGTHLQCNICGFFFRNLARHLRYHKTTPREYKQKYQLAIKRGLISEELRLALRKKNLSRPQAQKEATLRALQEANKHKIGKISNAHHKHSLEKKNLDGRCYYQLLDKIEALAKKLARIPTKREFMAEYGSGIMGTVYDTFGSWGQALLLAGFKPRDQYNQGHSRHSRESVIEMLQNFNREEGTPPRSSDLGGGVLPSNAVIRRLFGGIIEARRAAGLGQYDYVHETGEEV